MIRISRLDSPRKLTCGSSIHLDTVVNFAAEHLVNRNSRRLACQVPKRHIYARNCRQLDRSTEVAGSRFVHHVPQLLDLGRIFADEERLDSFYFSNDRFWVVFEIRLAETDVFGIGVNPKPNPAWRNFDDFK